MNLRIFRLKNGKSQSEIAKFLNITQTAYSAYETAKNEPPIDTLIKLADYFHTTVDTLLGHDVPFLLDKSTLTEQQRVIAELLPYMSNNVCAKAEAYINGLLEGEKEQLAIIQRFKR